MEPLPYVDEKFVQLARLAFLDSASTKGRVVLSEMCECAAGVVAIHDRFFYDPKRWKLRKGGPGKTDWPIVEVQCKGLDDVSDVVAFARKKLVACKGDTWREDILEKE